MKSQVTLQVSTEVAQALRQRTPPTADSLELSQLLEKLGVDLEAVHSDTEDPLLVPWFVVEAPDPAAAEQVLASLQQSRVVRAAYVKPPDALP